MKNKQKQIQAIAFFLLAAGLLVLLYPVATQWLYGRQVQGMVSAFEQEVGQPGQENRQGSLLDDLYRRMQQENNRLFTEGQTSLKDPFSYEQPGFDLKEYGLEEGAIGYLVLPKLNETLPIYLGASTENMVKGAVHLTETSYPVGGENTNAVLAAHRGYYKAAMFRNIQKLEVGDEVFVRNFRDVLCYQVAELAVINPDEIDKVLIRPGQDMLTLITCHPYGRNTYRYIVYCTRVPTTQS